MSEIEAQWQRPLQAAICEHCDWNYLFSPGEEMPVCPHCYRERLTHLDEEELEASGVPELVVPFSVSNDRVVSGLNNFSKRFHFSPKDLQAKMLVERMRRVFIPAWLVDSDVAAAWQAEAGFNYQVVSHQENFAGNSWQTKEVKETKIRWESRAGQLQRRYDNVRAPALEEIGDVRAKLGSFERDDAQAYRQEMLEQTLIRLPNRDRQDAWPDTQPLFMELAAGECREAAGADHIRQYKWQAQYANQDWSLLLLPVYSTWYYDDDQQPQPVLINGRTGKLSGVMRASMKQAKRATTLIAIGAGLLFLLTLILLFFEPSLALLTALFAFAAGLGAIWPIAYVSRFNRDQTEDIPLENSQQLTENG